MQRCGEADLQCFFSFTCEETDRADGFGMSDHKNWIFFLTMVEFTDSKGIQTLS